MIFFTDFAIKMVHAKINLWTISEWSLVIYKKKYVEAVARIHIVYVNDD